MKKTVLLVLTLVILVAILAAGCGGGARPMGWAGCAIGGDSVFVASMTGKVVGLSAAGGDRVWGGDYAVTATVSSGFGCSSANAAVPVYGTPVSDGEWVYFAGYSNGRVYSINAATGKERWVYPASGGVAPIVSGLALAGTNLFFATTEGGVYCLDTAIQQNDRKLWEFQAGDKIWSTPVVSDDTVYFGSYNKKLYALNAADGTLKWAFEAGGSIVGSPVVSDNVIYFGALDRKLYAVNADGTLKWKSEFTVGKWFWATPVVKGGRLYAPNQDGKVYIVIINSGELLAVPDLGAPVSSSPVLAASGNDVIIATENGQVYSISNDEPRLLATLKTSAGRAEVVYAPLATAGGNVVYIHTQSQPGEAVYALDVATGNILWHAPGEGEAAL